MRYNANPHGPTGAEAAVMLGVSRRAIYRYIERGILSYPITCAALQNVTRPTRGPQRNPMSRRYTEGRHTFRARGAIMTAPCPHCGAAHNIAARFNGDAVFCWDCKGWFLVRFLPGGAQLTKCDAPVTWPKERRKAR